MYVQRSEFVGFDNIPYTIHGPLHLQPLRKDSHGWIQILQLQCENCSINANHKPKMKRFIHSKHKRVGKEAITYDCLLGTSL
jgi:hypothetical protein